MNERIRELAEQCTTINDSTTIPVDKDFDYEKFAQLIVRECADICDDNDNFLQAKIIKKHFGVEL